jgi:hypothetical protein
MRWSNTPGHKVNPVHGMTILRIHSEPCKYEPVRYFDFLFRKRVPSLSVEKHAIDLVSLVIEELDRSPALVRFRDGNLPDAATKFDVTI